MFELTGQDYIDMLKKLNVEDLVYEFIKQTVVANKHMEEVSKGNGEYDRDTLFRYDAVASEVVQRLIKNSRP